MDDIILDKSPGQHWEPVVRKPWRTVNIVMGVLDSHRSTYLSFYTDTVTLDRYAQSFGGTRTQTPRLEDVPEEKLICAYYAEYPNCPTALPFWVASRVAPPEDLHGAVIYEHSSSSRWFSGPGMLLDYDSGYVIFWT